MKKKKVTPGSWSDLTDGWSITGNVPRRTVRAVEGNELEHDPTRQPHDREVPSQPRNGYQEQQIERQRRSELAQGQPASEPHGVRQRE